MIDKLFEIRGSLNKRTIQILQVSGFVFFIILWIFLSSSGIIPRAILPPLGEALGSFKELHFENELIRNLFYSLKLNYLGYIVAIAVCIPIGFVVGLFPIFNGMFQKQIDAIRFIPLTATTGIFIVAFGIGTGMKTLFLAFGIIVYLLPIVVQRVKEVEMVYQQTAFTLGATKWQMIKSVFFPSVISKLSDDIRVIVAISWTYIIIAEMINSEGGVGSMLYLASRQSRIDKVFAILITIILIGFLQDKLFKWADKKLFAFKHL